MIFRNIAFGIISIIEIVFIFLILKKLPSSSLSKWVIFTGVLTLFIATVWYMLFPSIKEIKPTGTSIVEYSEDYFTDTSRKEEFKNDGSNRMLQVGIWYPKDKEDSKCPLIIFSHGSFGTIENNKTLCVELASRGAIVISIPHTYHASSTTLSDKTKVKISSEFMKEIMSDNPKKDINKSYEHFKKWMKLRTDDISFIIDKAKSYANENKDIYKMIDVNEIIVMGHSLGGNAALGMPRLRDDIKMVVALESSFMCDIVGVDGDKFVYIEDEYPVPFLNIYTDSLYPNLGNLPQYVQNYKYLNSDNEKYHSVYIKGIGHMHLCDFQLETPIFASILSGKSSKTTATYNLKKVNEIVYSFLKDNGVNIE